MLGKNLLEGHGPVTQSIGAIKSLLAYVGRASDPLPADVSLENGRLILILSNKKDCYYATTATKCSCPSAAYRSGASCKHQRKYFAEEADQTKPKVTESLIMRGGFRPVDTLPSEERAEKSSPLSVIDCHDTTALDVAYHSIREDKILWPLEA